MTVKIFFDGADLEVMREMAGHKIIEGWTTNPSLMRLSGITRYADFARAVLDVADGKPVSFEVLADQHYQIERQARLIASWGPNVNVKIPITDTRGTSLMPLATRLALEGLKLNVTAVMTLEQVALAARALNGTPGIVSVFAGRIADTGVDPVMFMTMARKMISKPTMLLWASARQSYDAVQAGNVGADIITLSKDLLLKCALVGVDLAAYSMATVKQFHDDAKGIEL